MLEGKVEAFLDRHSFTLEHKKIVVGVSGGPDSLALLHYLLRQKEKRSLSIVVAHVDHMFRGQESFDDAMFVKNYCEQNAIPFEMAQINVPERMKLSGKSSELEAREARYEFFAKVMKKYGYSILALAHHGDDQVETILMRLTRGSTGKARAGIPFTRPFENGVIFRPFLCVTKDEIKQYCNKYYLEPRIDSTNETDLYSRNRFRKKVLPFLKKENGHVHEHFQRYSEELQSDESFLQELTVQSMNTVMKIDEVNGISIDIKKFLEMPLPLQRRGIQLILNYLYKEKPASLSAIHIDQILSFIHQPRSSGQLDLPNGLKVIRSYFDLCFQFQVIESESYHFEMNGPGVVDLPYGGSIQLSLIEKPVITHHSYAVFNADKLKWPITIRSRKTGDRMTLKGMSGSKKLKSIFIDSKVPLPERDKWPVITDGEGCIIWLPGLKKSSDEGMDDKANHYILLTYLSSRGHNLS
jgi:tRNA(Ile)-lysidine synthase